MRTLLLEDEALAACRLVQLLRQHPQVELLAQLATVEEGLAWFGQHPMPDLILADIQLADGLSFEIFDAVVIHCPIIFISSYDHYALQAFALHSIDYLLKPLSAAALSRALGKYARWHQPPAVPAGQLQHLLDALPLRQLRYRQRFLVSSGEQLLPVAVGEVAYFFTAREVVYLVRPDGRRFGIDYKLDHLEKLLDPTRFFRVNRQFLVPFSSVAKLHTQPGGKLRLELTPTPADEVLVSRERAPALKRWLEEESLPA